jgi:hypothetical protein
MRVNKCSIRKQKKSLFVQVLNKNQHFDSFGELFLDLGILLAIHTCSGTIDYGSKRQKKSANDSALFLLIMECLLFFDGFNFRDAIDFDIRIVQGLFFFLGFG